MKRHAPAGWNRKGVSLAAILVCAVAFSGCNKLKARDLLNRGVQAYKNGLYDEAIADFQKARDLDPGLLNAQLYLGTAYASQYIPGAPSEENISKGTQAIKEFQEVLKVDPNNLTAIDHIGSILFLMAGTPFSPEKFEESKSYHERHIRLKRDDPEPYYWVAVIDWTLAYRANVDIRLSYNKANPRKQIKDEDPLPPKYREEYTAKYQAMVEEGIQELNTAIKLRPDYEDAMAYLNFLYRRKADMVESAEERASLIKQADDLLDKVKEIKQQKANQPQKS
jgi:tetratricopeptide (TPR) repeat protein